MVTSTAFATCLGWSVSPGMHWSVSPGMGGQLAPECGGQVQQNLHTIAEQFEKLKEIDRFETWLETKNGENEVDDFLRRKFDSCIPLEYLNIDRLRREIGFDNGEVYDEVYKLLLEAADNYACHKEEWHFYD